MKGLRTRSQRLSKLVIEALEEGEKARHATIQALEIQRKRAEKTAFDDSAEFLQ